MLEFATRDRGSPPASNFSLSDVDVGDALQFINHISHRSWVRASYSALSFSHVDVGDPFQFDVWRGANPRPMVLNVSALPLHHSDLLYFVSSLDDMI